MAKQSSQKFIARNRAPRVQIEYDVELYGAEKKMQLPFVMGVLADLSGKPVAVFITHEGSGLGRSVVDVKKLCPKAIVLEGLAVRGGRVGSAAGLVQEWLRTIGAIR